MSKNKIILFSLVALIFIIILIYFTINNRTNTTPSNRKSPDNNSLIGDWLRTDADYVIKIKSVNDDGIVEAQYFNPKPINIGRANWVANNGDLKIVVELRDVNYPGSTYTLYYLADRDMLVGDYFQAVEGVTFYVEFSRNK